MASQLADEFVDFLVAVCEADGDTEYADKLLAAARDAIGGSGGGLSSLLSTGLNGKSFTRAVHLNAVEVAVACQRAIAIHNENEMDVAATYPDFRNLQR